MVKIKRILSIFLIFTIIISLSINFHPIEVYAEPDNNFFNFVLDVVKQSEMASAVKIVRDEYVKAGMSVANAYEQAYESVKEGFKFTGSAVNTALNEIKNTYKDLGTAAKNKLINFYNDITKKGTNITMDITTYNELNLNLFSNIIRNSYEWNTVNNYIMDPTDNNFYNQMGYIPLDSSTFENMLKSYANSIGLDMKSSDLSKFTSAFGNSRYVQVFKCRARYYNDSFINKGGYVDGEYIFMNVGSIATFELSDNNFYVNFNCGAYMYYTEYALGGYYAIPKVVQVSTPTKVSIKGLPYDLVEVGRYYIYIGSTLNTPEIIINNYYENNNNQPIINYYTYTPNTDPNYNIPSDEDWMEMLRKIVEEMVVQADDIKVNESDPDDPPEEPEDPEEVEGWLTTILKFISSMFETLLENITSLINEIFSISDLIDSIGGFFSNLIDSIDTFFVELLTGILEGLKELLTTLFVPNESYWSGKYGTLENKLRLKLPYETYIVAIESLKNAGGIGTRSTAKFEDFTFNLFEKEYVLPWSEPLNKVTDMIRGWIRAFFMLLMAYYNYRQILFLIRGTTYTSIGVNKKGE